MGATHWLKARMRWIGDRPGDENPNRTNMAENPETHFVAANYCADCCFRQDPSLPPGRTVCDQCENSGHNESWEAGAHRRRAIAALDRAGAPVNGAHAFLDECLRNGWLAPDSSLDDVRVVVRYFWDELADDDRVLIRSMLEEKVSPEPDTFEMFARWGRSRLSAKYRRINRHDIHYER